jgi:2-oxoglutarate dehydrogenase E2 component (dihydrolipoamide succinyltransferase)
MERKKLAFEKREIDLLNFMEAVAEIVEGFPRLNISVDGDFIIKKKHQFGNGGILQTSDCTGN